MAAKFILRFSATKKNPPGEWQLKRNMKHSFWHAPKGKSGFEILGVKLSDSDWKRRPNLSTYKHGRARLTDVLKSLAAAGIPSDDVLVKTPYPAELGPIYDEALAEKV